MINLNTFLGTIPLSPDAGFAPGGVTGRLGSPGANPNTTFAVVISSAIGLITAIAFIYFIFNLFIGAFNVITAGGDKAQVEGARKKITNSLLGLVVTISAIFVVELVGKIFGINILNMAELITNIAVQ